MIRGSEAIAESKKVRFAVDGIKTARAISVTVSANSPAMSCCWSG
jgi:hypothetical protein